MRLQDIWTRKIKLGPEAIASDEQLCVQIQSRLIALNLLGPPADGRFGPISLAALHEFQELMKSEEQGFLGASTAKALIEAKPEDLPQPEIILGCDFASAIVKYMRAKNYQIATGSREYNIVYVEGCDQNGIPNADAPNEFNDRRLVLQILDSKPVILGNWEGTTEPGYYYTDNPMNPAGAARIQFGQYKAWKVDIHYGGGADPHEALVQYGEIAVTRDYNRDMSRAGDEVQVGDDFGVNQHWGYDLPSTDISLASAGCLVGRTREGHREFMALIKQDRRYQLNNDYMFWTAILPGNEL